MLPAPALPRTTANDPLSCPPEHDASLRATAADEATAARTTARSVMRRFMPVLRHRSAESSQVLVEERRVAEAAVGVASVAGHGAEAGPAEALVQPVGGTLADSVKDEER